MGTIKAIATDASATDFLNGITVETKKQDSLKLLEIFTRLTGEQPKMWGTSIVGFGLYHYKSERSAQEGDWPLIGFSPRKQNLTLYIMLGFDEYQDLLAKLGKHKTSVGCLYINMLADVNMTILEKLIAKSFADMKKKHNN